MPRIRLPKWRRNVDDWISNFIREFEAYDQKSLHREADLTKGLKVTDGEGGFFFYQQIKPLVKTIDCSGASVTIANMIQPSIVYGCFSTVNTLITGATGFDIGTPTDTDAWGNNLPVTKMSRSSFKDYTDRSISVYPIPTDVIVTSVGGNFTGGQVEVVLFYSDFVN